LLVPNLRAGALYRLAQDWIDAFGFFAAHRQEGTEKI
jgi:hypothetical protein